ncbi:MAG: glycine cleavage system aminomethyltransferase GcvT [Acidimicrobiia bacterium]|nr:glycine cleavage system aminomethyltransferase GcvT [Acidimicrobiia bacterium]
MSRTGPLHDLNAELGAKFTDFGGWAMPVQYESVVSEHMAVRQAAGWFDVSHLGRFRLLGPEAAPLIGAETTIDSHATPVGRTAYGLVLNEDGGIADDIVIWRLGDEEFIVLPNAANHEMVLDRFAAGEPDDLRDTTVLIAVQGPDAPGLLEATTGFDGPRFSASIPADGLIVAGTGYTGERGGEVIIDVDGAVGLVEALTTRGAVPCGLGARDTLRLEAALPLWGQDMDTTTNPYEVGLGFAVNLDHEFVGRSALDPSEPSRRRLFTTASRRIPRHDQTLLDASGDPVGRVTSGSFSPVRGEGIGMGLVQRETDSLAIDMRGTAVPVELVSRRFI